MYLLKHIWQRFWSFFKGLRGSQVLLRVILRLWRLLVPFVSANAKPMIPDYIDRPERNLADGISDTVICASVMPTTNFVESPSSASASQCPSLPSTSACVAAITPPPRPRLEINTGGRRSTADSLATLVASPSSFTPSWKKGKRPAETFKSRIEPTICGSRVGWEMHVHPEGQPYFVTQWTESPNFAVITENNVWEKDVATRVMDFVQLLFELLNALDHGDFNGSDVDLVVSGLVYWIRSSSFGNFTGVIKSTFPHRTVPDKWSTELISTLSFNVVGKILCDQFYSLIHRVWTKDITTSPTHTCPYDRQTVDTILWSLKNIKEYHGLARTAVIGRVWAQIYEARFFNYYGEPEARLHRKQIAIEGWGMPHPLMKMAFLALFDAPSVQLSTMREVYSGKVLYADGWHRCMGQLCESWGDIILQATVLLTGDRLSNVHLSSKKTNPCVLKANMGFLAVFNSTQQVVEENLAVTCSMASTLLSTASIVIGLLHVRKLNRQHPLAIMYSLPYALLMWAMVSFVAAILLYVFKSGVSTHSEIILASLALSLGVTLIWVIQFFWKDDLKFDEDLQSLWNILMLSSPLALFRKWHDKV
ncbi:hypothetical protein BU17DRAFT_67845 [Hysterangium stoloniferum]|nr:hypothetical protein BU17DRAFT_67845 [Hysterangium stoloniferum]